jgi:hypothetical protein
MKQGLDRWAPLSGVLSVICSVVGVMLVLGQPQEKDSDAKITAYFSSHAHRVQSGVGFFVFLAGVVLLLIFLGSLRERLRAAEGEAGGTSSLVFSAGIASVPLWVVSMLLANGVAFAAGEGSAFHVEPNTFRVLATMSYFAWVAAVVVSAVVVWGTSAVSLRTGMLPRWFGIAGIAVGVVQLFGYFLFPFFVWWLWIIVASMLLVRRRAVAPATVPQPAL